MIKNFTKQYCSKIGIELNDTQIEQFAKYYELLIDWNSKLNLTRITEPEEVAIKHFADSLTLLNYYDVNKNAKVIDVGTGAGFPGIPLKIARPDIQLTLLDSLNKRLVFLKDVCDNIGIDAEIVHSRAEDGGQNQNFREKFDVVVSRAVARMNVLSEYCIPYVKVGGAFVAMKGPDLTEEIKESEKAISLLGGKVDSINEFSIPDESNRTIAVVKKERYTINKYPRQGVKIRNNPL